eukprot:5883614-Amphidinium_carterae.1
MRVSLSDGPIPVGVRALHESASTRLYAAVHSCLHVMSEGLEPITVLRGGPRSSVNTPFSTKMRQSTR